MADTDPVHEPSSSGDGAVAHPEVLEPAAGRAPARREGVSEPAKVMRIGAMTKQLLDELRETTLDQPSRERLRSIHATAVAELSQVLSPDLQAELEAFALPFEDDAPSEIELRVAQAQLVGWLEGLFQGIQLTLLSQQMAAKSQLEDMRSQARVGPTGPARGANPMSADTRPGTYL